MAVTKIVFTSDDAPDKSATATLTQDGDNLNIKVEFNPNGANLLGERYTLFLRIALQCTAMYRFGTNARTNGVDLSL